MDREAQKHALQMANALTEGEQVCIALKALISLTPVGIGTLKTWIADGTSVSEGYERVYLHFKDDPLYELAAFFMYLVRKGVDPDDFLTGCRLLDLNQCRDAVPYLKDLTDKPVILSRPQD